MTKRKVFISYHHDDQIEVDEFIDRFAYREGIFIPKMLGINGIENDLINSTNPAYVMHQIRQRYLQDSTVTIVLVGSCTHSRRYVDWELKASLTQGSYTPNGVMGIILPSQGESANLPPRLNANWKHGHENCYARYWIYPRSANELANWIEDAFDARTSRCHLITNSQSMMRYNSRCNIHGVTH
jgi:hypothetical protein